METRKIKGMNIPVIGLGSANTFDVGSTPEIENVRRILENCLDQGSTFIDTSPMYRRAEEAIGRAMDGSQTKFQLATKVWCSGKQTGIDQMERSFALLKREFIEVMQIHNLMDWQTHLPVLEDMKHKGLIGLIGATHYAPSSLAELAKIMRTGRVDVIQISYNVMEREVEEEILPLAGELDIGVIVMRPVGAGLLFQRLSEQPDLAPLAPYGIKTWGQALMAWILAEPTVTTLIPATTRPARIRENAAVGSISIPDDAKDYILSEALRCLLPGNYRLGD